MAVQQLFFVRSLQAQQELSSRHAGQMLKTDLRTSE